MATIDILCVIDTNGLMKKGLSSGSLENPTQLGSYDQSDTFVFMICDGQYACNDQGKSELTVNANVGDTVRWTITDPSTGLITGEQGQSYSCILYNFKSGSQDKTISAPALKSVPALSYYNNVESATTPAAAAYMCSSWTSSILKTGNVQYSWAFQIIDNYSGNIVGYYTWDPFINVQKKSVEVKAAAAV